MMTLLQKTWILIGVLSPWFLLAGCGQKQELIRGAAPTGNIVTVHDVTQPSALKATKARQNIGSFVLRGEMIEKCPIAGCWFKLRDATGVIKVDTKAAGFVVSDIPLHTQMTVQGRIVSSTDTEVAAAGIRY